MGKRIKLLSMLFIMISIICLKSTESSALDNIAKDIKVVKTEYSVDGDTWYENQYELKNQGLNITDVSIKFTCEYKYSYNEVEPCIYLIKLGGRNVLACSISPITSQNSIMDTVFELRCSTSKNFSNSLYCNDESICDVSCNIIGDWSNTGDDNGGDNNGDDNGGDNNGDDNGGDDNGNDNGGDDNGDGTDDGENTEEKEDNTPYFKVGDKEAKSGTTYRKYEQIKAIFKGSTDEDVLDGDWEDIKNKTFTYTITDDAGNEVEETLELYPLVEGKIDIDFEYVPDFKPYLVEDNVILKLRVFYGEEYVDGATIKNKQDGRAQIIGEYTEEEKVSEYGDDIYATVKYLIVNTNATPDKEQGLSFEFNDNEGKAQTRNAVSSKANEGKGTLTPPSVDQILKNSYTNQIFDISKGNITIDSNSICHFAKDLRGAKGKGENDSEEGSTVKIRGESFTLTGTTSSYTVKCELSGKNMILSGLNITTSDKSAIEISDSTVIKPEGMSNKIIAKGSNNAINISRGTLEVSGEKGGKITIECTNGGAGIGATNGANIKISHKQELTITTKDGAGIGSGQNGTAGNINMINPNITITVNGGGAGIGAGKSGKCGNITIQGNALTINLNGKGAAIGGGEENTSAGNIIVKDLDLTVNIGANDGCGIGAGYNGRCGSIEINESNVRLEGSSYKLGSAIGATSSGTTADITIDGSYVKIKKANVGIGADTSGICDNITIEGNLDISDCDVGIGAKGNVKKIKLEGSNAKITTLKNGLGIGSILEGIVSDINLNRTNVDISNCSVGIGTSRTMGNIKLTQCSKVIISADSVGIGCQTSDNSSKTITITGSKIQIKNTPSVGIGSTGKIGNVAISGSSEVKFDSKSGDSGSIGIGTSGTIGNISINKSNLDLGAYMIGIGVNSDGNMGNITIENDSKVKVSGQNVCIGSRSNNAGSSNITINSSQVEAEGDGVGIGASGKIGNISIKSCKSISVKVNDAAIGGGSGATCGKIEIEKSKMIIQSKDSSLTLGIGSDNFGSGSIITITDSILDISDIGNGAGIGVKNSNLSEISIDKSVIQMKARGSGAGIGSGSGNVNTIDLEKNIIGILHSGSGSGIGSGKNGSVGSINLKKNKMVIKGSSGAGIGSGEGGDTTGKIEMKTGTILLKSGSGAGIGSGKGGSAKNIEIQNGRIYVLGNGSGAGIGNGEEGSIESTIIQNGKIVLNMSNCSGSGIKGGSVTIENGEIKIVGDSGSGIESSDMEIKDGDIEIIINGNGDGIKGGGTIENGIIKTYSASGKAINGSNNIVIQDNANVHAYANNVSGVSGTQKKLTTDFLRNIEGVVHIGGNSNNKIKTDKFGDIYYWGNANEFDINGMKFVI